MSLRKIPKFRGKLVDTDHLTTREGGVFVDMAPVVRGLDIVAHRQTQPATDQMGNLLFDETTPMLAQSTDQASAPASTGQTIMHGVPVPSARNAQETIAPPPTVIDGRVPTTTVVLPGPSGGAASTSSDFPWALVLVAAALAYVATKGGQ